jgi:FkbM family methyltransferase
MLNKGALWLTYLKLIPILRKIGSDSVVLDCGANVGDVTEKFAATGAQVYAFEPDPVAFARLKKRFGARKNVTLIQKGVWDKNTQIPLYKHKDQKDGEVAFTVSSSIVSNKLNVDQTSAHTIEVIDLAEFIENLGRRVNLIKLDVEGAETEILKSIIAKATYHLFDVMYVETHETKIPGQQAELADIRRALASKGVQHIKLNWL